MPVSSGSRGIVAPVAALVAFAAGAGAAWHVTGAALLVHGAGPRFWSTSMQIGDAGTGALIRATTARTGLWALPKSEVIYYLTERDDAGRLLDTRCTYELTGESDLPARWWSIGAYADYHFVANAQDRYSYTRSNVIRDAGGGYTIVVSRHPQPGNWLPLGDRASKVQLLTRLYQPDPARTADAAMVPLPTVRRRACD